MSVPTEQLKGWIEDARARTFSMVEDLDDHQMSVPYLPSVNPFLWELGHGIWFQEYWVLRHALSGAPLIEDPDHLFDSAHVGHEMRWHLKSRSDRRPPPHWPSLRARRPKTLEFE